MVELLCVQQLLQMEQEGRAVGKEPGGSVRIRTPHSLGPCSPVVHLFRNCPSKEDRKMVTNVGIVFNYYNSVNYCTNICFYLLKIIPAALVEGENRDS